MLADQTVLRRAVAVRRQMVANRCRTCCDVSRWGAPAMLQHTNCAGHPSMCISETTRSSSVLFREACEYDGFQQGLCIDRARRAWRLRIRNGWHGRRHGNIGRSGCLRCFGCFDRAGCFGRFVRSIRPLYAGRLVAFQYIVPSEAASRVISKSSIFPQLEPDPGRTEADTILTSLVLLGSTVTVTSTGMHSALGRRATVRPACRLTPVGQHDETEHEGHRQHMAFEVVRR